MKLYELKKGDRFQIIPKSEEVFIFDHVDGMYSYCFWEDTKEVVHIAAFQEVEKLVDK